MALVALELRPHFQAAAYLMLAAAAAAHTILAQALAAQGAVGPGLETMRLLLLAQPTQAAVAVVAVV